MPMGTLNTAPTCVAMVMKIRKEWDILAEESGLKNVAPKIIVGDVLLYGNKAKHLLAHFRTVLNARKHQHAKLNLKSANDVKIGVNFS